MRHPAITDAATLYAWSLLKHLEPHACPPLDRVWVSDDLDDGVAARCDAGTVTISTRSLYYCGGDPLALALLLHHEQHHARYGPDEHAAYRASVAFAERHAPYLVDGVRRTWRLAAERDARTRTSRPPTECRSPYDGVEC